MKYWLLVFFTGILLSGCEKSISFKLDTTVPTVVVEASIENGQAPVVILSSSYDYFSTISPAILANSFVHNAVITLSNGVKTQQLKEYFFNTSANLKIYYYTIDSANPANAFLGAFNTAYALNIQANGKTYTATTSIPRLAKTVDSLWWKKAPDNPDTNKVVLVARAADPPGYGNYIRYYTKVNRDPFFPGLNSVFDDQIIDGKTYSADVERGINRNDKIDQDNYSFFNRGDTITLKFANIDRGCYDFWRTMEYSYASIGNPFSSPTKVLGNISGGLGYFGGYAAQYKTIIVPK
jgi:hypothetical protein